MRLHDYLHRVGVSGPLPVTAETLRRLHAAHREAFLFENITIQEGGVIGLALETLERKFLDDRRGGECFGQNTLFAAGPPANGVTPPIPLAPPPPRAPAPATRTHTRPGPSV